MTPDNTTLPTIERLKSRAKAIKKRDGVPHATALDRAAQASGFADFRHAQNVIEAAAARAVEPEGQS